MTQEDKDLLLKDLCSRLPYGVIGEYSWKGNEPYNRELTGSLYDELESSWSSTEDSEFIPYLRPMKSMTEEEKDELFFLCTMGNGDVNSYWEAFGVEIISTHPRFGDYYSTNYKVIDWLNKNMFDHRGLIPKELAIEVTKENNPYEY